MVNKLDGLRAYEGVVDLASAHRPNGDGTFKRDLIVRIDRSVPQVALADEWVNGLASLMARAIDGTDFHRAVIEEINGSRGFSVDQRE
jgi:hypothetical protein